MPFPNPAALDFGTVYVGGDLPKVQTVTITTGDHAVDLKLGSEPEHFTCTVGQTQLAQGRSTTVTIQPKADLKAGTYKERVRLTCGEHRGSVIVELQFVVKNTPSFKLSLTEMDFGTAKQGYTPEAQTLTVTNITGSSALLKKTTLSSSDFEFTLKLYEGGYSMSDGHTDDIAAVRPKAGLKAGTYTGTLTLEAEAGVTYTIPLKFVVVSGESALTAVPATLNFAAVAEGDYTPPAAHTVTITNT
ncbi:MAG: choice-of-anchor D domain-containing protein, partial [Oscillospiraceae bacterium]|nr:choice-of-anchor D domain-containing protein [Oscillospiraceae bacterium]